MGFSERHVYEGIAIFISAEKPDGVPEKLVADQSRALRNRCRHAGLCTGPRALLELDPSQGGTTELETDLSGYFA